MLLNWKPSKVFYGWWVVSAAFFIALYLAGTIFYGFTTIFEPIADEMGWSYTQISFAASLRGMEMGLLAPFIGILVDRWGPRRLIFIGAILAATGLFLLGRTMSLGMFYGAFALIALGMSCCTMTVLMTAVANWFRKRIGLASGIAISGFGFGGLLVPVIVRLIDIYEWRMTITILAVGMLAIVIPLSFLFRHKPEQYGYLPDGQQKKPVILDNGLGLPQTVELNVKMRHALRNRPFWHMALAFTCHAIVLGATITHVMPYLSSINVTKSTSSLIATAIPLASIIGRLGLGSLGDRFDRRRVVTVAFIMMGFGLFCFGYTPSAGTWLLVPFFLLFGIGYGGSNAIRPALVREYFGRTNFGTVFGLLMGINMLGSIIGPPLTGWVYDNWGSYHGIWLIFAALPVVSLISILTIPPSKGVSRTGHKA